MAQTVRMPLLVWDRQYLRDEAKPGGSDVLLATPFEWLDVRDVEDFYDGPVTSRVAVLDFAESGGLRPGARFLPQGVGKTVSCYDVKVPDIDDSDALMQFALMQFLESDAFIQVSTFATVMKTIQFFESPDALGRRITWAFDPPQLLVLPRAGRLANAFYERESGSLQFFYCQSSAGPMIYTALSHDIIVHETAHAILDGVAPDLYHATRTESLALHEAIADLAAIVLTLLNDMILFSLDAISGGKLDKLSALAKVAEEFGTEMRRDIGVDFLRLLDNRRTLDPDSTDLADPYEVSEVLSGAIYQVFIDCACSRGSLDLAPEDVGEEQIRQVRGHIARMVFRALDYLPPGEASLADFGRAMIAAHDAVYAGKRLERRLLARELVERKVVSDERELEGDGDLLGRELPGVDPQELLEDDAAAGRFAQRYRDLLRIPGGADFQVQPRRKRTRAPARSRKQKPLQDLVLRVTWEAEGEHDLGARFASRWTYPVGTTLALDWDTGRVLSLLTTDQGGDPHADRDRTLRSWMKKGLLRTPEEAMGLDGQPRSDALIARKTGRAMQVTGSARVLCS